MRALAPLLLALGLAVAAAGCSGEETREPRRESPEQRDARLSKAIERNPNDPEPYYERGQLDEERGDLAHAVEDYGSCVLLLPPRRWTRPALSLGRVHWKLGHADAARRLLEEVVTTVPADASLRVENPDFREAALLLKDVYAKVGDARAAARLRERFLGEFGGKPADWPETP